MLLATTCQKNHGYGSVGLGCVAVGMIDFGKKATFQGRPALARIVNGFYAGFSDVSLKIFVRNPPFWCSALVLFWAPGTLLIRSRNH